MIEQWAFDHARKIALQEYYGHIDSTTITWSVEILPLDDLTTVPTGAPESAQITSLLRRAR